MAIKDDASSNPAGAGKRRMVLGTNVLVATIFVVGIVVTLQAIAFHTPGRIDMTTTRVNSLGDGTKSLLSNLESNVTLTSLYFETDREEADQPLYRRAVQDLLQLYQTSNRGRVSADWINPLKDHEKFKKLVTRLREKPELGKGLSDYKESVEAYIKDGDGFDTRMRALIDGELAELGKLGGAIGGQAANEVIAPVEITLRRLLEDLETTRKTVNTLAIPEDPQYTAAVNELRELYRGFTDTLNRISTHGTRAVSDRTDLTPEQTEFLRNTGQRYAQLVAAVDEAQQKLQSLETPKIDEMLVNVEPTSNAIIVETDNDARVVDFTSMWPPLDPTGSTPNVRFGNRAFKGEEMITAAILRVTHKEQTGVVFVRYGGSPVLGGGPIPGQQRGPYMAMKQQLENANFLVREWDLKTEDKPPAIEPAPVRILYIVLQPTPNQRDPMGRPSQEPPFGDVERRKLLDLLGDNGRALFVVGWNPGPFGAIPANYEYADYLEKTWGISIDSNALLVQFGSIGPGRYYPNRRDFFVMDGVEASDHDILGNSATNFALPWCAPLTLPETPPEGVEISRLISQPKREGIWGVKDLQGYEAQLQEQQYLSLREGDREGPFELAVAASKGNAKIVVVSSRTFAEDNVAFARGLMMTPQGFQLRMLYPGNSTLLVNSLHWLNDNVQFMNIGQPIDVSVLKIGKSGTIRAVQALTVVVWPALALLAGAGVWWVRRR